jgi:pimeloyl-ACP methyl ester carboxylesterase
VPPHGAAAEPLSLKGLTHIAQTHEVIMKIKRILSGCSLILLFAVASLVAHAQAQKTDVPTKPTIVIVHGAWGGSWAFRKVEALLREKGFNVYRPQLTGLGERVHLARPDIGLSTHIDDVVNTILFEYLHDIILVGHSYGGMVITGVADRVPDRIRRLIYVDAFVPNDGESVMSFTGTRGDWLKPMIKGDYIVPPWVKPDQPPPKDVPQPLKTFTESIALKNKAGLKVPASYILTVDAGKEAKDDDFWPQAQRARERGWPVEQLTADHNAQWSAPEALVEMLARIH